MDEKSGKRPERKPEDVDKCLHVAFGGEGESALDALERLAGVQSRIHLADGGEEDSPILRVPDADEGEATIDDPRYQTVGEIARGGVGVVLKSRDRDLGRDVAVKVLKEDLARVPEVVRRFVEEAQIGGQLQHPGVVPVYGLGVQRDGRPYFAMKLVKGETLAAQIRTATEEDRPRFISAFQSVCQTVAYAHARNVIHRDLKPANILIGSFGEVQVVDWGFAKVLSRGGVADEHREAPPEPDRSVIETIRSGSTGSESRVGSVMGTPGYMPPEQARGETEKIDERADVFSLGAILTEILTGKPPYTGKSAQQLQQAISAKLDRAHARLDASGADPVLIQLAKDCMAPSPEARPRDAGRVVAAVSKYLHSLETEKRKAELDAATARRTRRLSVALFAAVLLALVLGGGGWYMTDAAERTSRERARVAVDQALRKAGVLLGRAQAADDEDLSGWPLARKEAEAAAALAGEVHADNETRQEADDFLAQVVEEERAAQRLAITLAEDRRLSDELREVRLSRHPEVGSPDAARSYDEVFRERGVAVLTDPAEEVVEWVRGRTIEREIVEALDDWVHHERDAKRSPARLHALLAILDPDELRDEIRAAVGNLNRLEEFCEREDLEQLPPDTLFLLAEALGNAGTPGTATDVCRVLREKEPESVRSSLALGYWLTIRYPREYAEAVDLLAPLVARMPQSQQLLRLLADFQEYGGRIDAAIATRRRIREIQPDDAANRKSLAKHLIDRARRCHQSGETLSAVHHMEASFEMEEPTTGLLSWYGSRLVELNATARAEATARQILSREPNTWPGHMLLGDALLNGGRVSAALESYRRAEGISPRSSRMKREIGRALARLGRLEEAVTCWKKGAVLQPEYSTFWLYIGHASLRLGRRDEARVAYEKAAELSGGAEGEFALFRLHEMRGDGERARIHLDRAIAASIRRGLMAMSSPQAYSPRALGYLVGRRYQGREAAGLASRWFSNWSSIGKAQFLSGVANSLLHYRADPAAAREVLEEAIRIAPDSYTARMELATQLDKCGRSIEALSEARKTVKVGRGTGSTLATLVECLIGAGELREAGRLAGQMAQSWPNWTTTAESVLQMSRLARQMDEILGGSRKLEDPTDLHSFSATLWAAGKYPEALRYLKESIQKREPLAAPFAECRRQQADQATAATVALGAAGDSEGADRIDWIRKGLAHLGLWLDALEREEPYLWLPMHRGAGGTRRLRSSQIIIPLVGRQFACIREEEQVVKLPEDLQEECRKIYERVRKLHRRYR